MQEFEGSEREPRPRWESIDLVALRRHNNTRAAELRTSLPLLLAGIIGEVPCAKLALTMIADLDGMVDVTVSASADTQTSTVATEVASAVEPIAETALRENPSLQAALVWAVVPERRPALGVPVDGEPRSRTVRCHAGERWHVGEDEPRPWIEDLAALPGQGRPFGSGHACGFDCSQHAH